MNHQDHHKDSRVLATRVLPFVWSCQGANAQAQGRRTASQVITKKPYFRLRNQIISLGPASHLETDCKQIEFHWICWRISQFTSDWYHGRLARWRKWKSCDVGEAKEGL